MFKPIVRVAALSLCCLVLAGGALRAEEYSPKQLLSFAMELNDRGQHKDAVLCAAKAVVQIGKQCGQESIPYAQYLAVLADYMHRANQNDAAEKIYMISFQILGKQAEKNGDALPIMVVETYQLGCFFKDLGNHADAEKYLKMALLVAQKTGMQNIASQAQAALQSL